MTSTRNSFPKRRAEADSAVHRKRPLRRKKQPGQPGSKDPDGPGFPLRGNICSEDEQRLFIFYRQRGIAGPAGGKGSGHIVEQGGPDLLLQHLLPQGREVPAVSGRPGQQGQGGSLPQAFQKGTGCPAKAQDPGIAHGPGSGIGPQAVRADAQQDMEQAAGDPGPGQIACPDQVGKGGIAVKSRQQPLQSVRQIGRYIRVIRQ